MLLPAQLQLQLPLQLQELFLFVSICYFFNYSQYQLHYIAGQGLKKAQK